MRATPTQDEQIRGLTNVLAGILRSQPNMMMYLPVEDCVRNSGETIHFEHDKVTNQIWIRIRASINTDERHLGIDPQVSVSDFAPGLDESPVDSVLRDVAPFGDIVEGLHVMGEPYYGMVSVSLQSGRAYVRKDDVIFVIGSRIGSNNKGQVVIQLETGQVVFVDRHKVIEMSDV